MSSGCISTRPIMPWMLWVDDGREIQALDRRQPLLPMQPGQTARHTRYLSPPRDDRRCLRRSTRRVGRSSDAPTAAIGSIEFRKFLDLLEAAVPPSTATST